LGIAPWWKRCRLGDIAEITNGAAFKSAQFNTERDGLPLIRIRDVGQPEASTYYSGDYETRYLVECGDLLIGMDGDFRIARWSGTQSLLNQRVCRLRVQHPDCYSDKFLEHVVQPYLDEIHKVTSAVTVKHLSSRTVGELPIPLPPRLEQEQIVAAIEEHFSRLDAAEATLRTARRRCQALIKSVIIGAIPNEAPADWQHKRVADAGHTGLGRQRSPKYHRGTKMMPYLRVANVFEDRIDGTDVMQMHFDEDDFEKYRLRDGDVLLNEGQSPELLGRPAIYRGEPPDVAFTNSLIRFVPKPGITSEWALIVFRRHMHSGRFKQESRITTNIAHLALGRFRTVEFPIPPLEVQERIVAASRDALDAVDRQIVQIDRAIATLGSLRRSVLAAAFSGRLVPQNSDDEPASMLLERIAASRPAKPARQRART